MYPYPHYSLSVLTKLPVPGQVKTRMQPDYSPEFSRALHERLVDYVLAQWLQAAQCPVHLWLAGEAAEIQPLINSSHFRSFALPVALQRGRDLGERLLLVVNAQLAHYRGVFLVGTDCPFIDRNYLQAACDGLDNHDTVIGPAEDGGYVLLGLKKPIPALFETIAWGTERVFEQTMTALNRLRLSCYTLPVLPDIDRPADLALLDAIPGFHSLPCQ